MNECDRQRRGEREDERPGEETRERRNEREAVVRVGFVWVYACFVRVYAWFLWGTTWPESGGDERERERERKKTQRETDC